MTYRSNARTRTAVTVVPLASALACAARQRDSGTRMVRTGVLGWFGMSGDGTNAELLAHDLPDGRGVVRVEHEVVGFGADRLGEGGGDIGGEGERGPDLRGVRLAGGAGAGDADGDCGVCAHGYNLAGVYTPVKGNRGLSQEAK